MKTFTYKELWAMSDIHGYYDQAVELLQKIGILDNDARLIEQDDVKVVFVGDYIDRGPKPLETLLLVESLVSHGIAKAVLGNHDSWYLRKLKGADVMMNEERSETLGRIKSSPLYWVFPDIERDLLEFLDSLPLHLTIDGINFAHAYYSKSGADKDKKHQRFMMYGPTTGRNLDNGYPERVAWYETYDGRHGKIIFGHYSLADTISEFPHCVSVDCAVFRSGILGAYEVFSRRKEYCVREETPYI
jgi:protein phosphatase